MWYSSWNRNELKPQNTVILKLIPTKKWWSALRWVQATIELSACCYFSALLWLHGGSNLSSEGNVIGSTVAYQITWGAINAAWYGITTPGWICMITNTVSQVLTWNFHLQNICYYYFIIVWDVLENNEFQNKWQKWETENYVTFTNLLQPHSQHIPDNFIV